jgi:linoleoyl-CoA desaturase
VVDKDGDIEQLPLARFAPDQPWSPWHPWQHFYMFVLYGFYAPRQVLMGDFSMLLRGPRAHVPMPRPHGADLWQLVISKVVFFGLFLVLPMFFQPWWGVLLGAFVTLWILGIILAVVFQLAHCVDEADFTSEARLIAEAEEDGPREWARHQVEHTVDFARKSRVLNWYLGGLNFQVEHHLLPQVCHVHYRSIAPIVEELSAKHGFRYNANDSLWSALGSHARWLKRMGVKPTGAVTA